MIHAGSLAARLGDILGHRDLLIDDTSKYAVDGRAPQAVVFPRTVEQVAQVVALAGSAGVAIVPVGNGNYLGLGNVPRKVDLVLSLVHLDQVVEYDIANLTVTVQAGLSLGDLQASVGPHRQFLPLDPPLGGRATVGGILAANASGPRRLLYGSGRDLLLGLRVVLADGRMIRTGGKVVKNVTGYDMNKLFLGSLGTLGVILEATFRLWPQPETEKMAVLSFGGLGPAAAVAGRILDSELIPSTLEILNPLAAACISRQVPFGELDGLHWLLVGAEGFSEAVDRQVAQVGRFCGEVCARELRVVEGEELARLRSALAYLPTAAGEEGEVVACKASVPASQVERAVRVLSEAAEAEGLRCAIQAGRGTGIVWGFLVGQSGEDSASRLASAVETARQGAVAAGGSLVLHSAPGPVKERVDAWGPVGGELRLFQSMKRQMDPAGILSPGRFVGGL